MNANDVIEITESESPWIKGTWLGKVREIFPSGDGYVQPVETNPEKVEFLIRPNDKYLAERGLYLTKLDLDKAKLVQPTNG